MQRLTAFAARALGVVFDNCIAEGSKQLSNSDEAAEHGHETTEYEA